MKELVTSSLHSVDFERHDVLEDLLHQVLLLDIGAEAHVRLEVATDGCRCLCSVGERSDIGRRGIRLIDLTVIEVEKARLSGAYIGSRRVPALTRERFMDYANKRAALHSDAYHVGDILKAPVSEGIGAVDRIDPNGNIIHRKVFSEGSRDEVLRRTVFLNNVSKLVLVVCCLLAAALRCLLKQALCQHLAPSSLKDLLRLDEGRVGEVISLGGLFAFANELNTREKLAQIVQIGLSDEIVDIRDVFFSCAACRGGRGGVGAFKVCLLDEVASLLDHHDAVIDQVAELDDRFGVLLHFQMICFSKRFFGLILTI